MRKVSMSMRDTTDPSVFEQNCKFSIFLYDDILLFAVSSLKQRLETSCPRANESFTLVCLRYH